MTLLQALFQAYEDARRHKRNAASALAFEIDYESKLFQLHEEIMSGTYQIGPSVCFISFHPVKREVFAAQFRDRIVHHLLYNFINPTFERLFINDCYSCRKRKGTSYGIRRVDHFMRSCSENYSRDCHILKLDISGYFMAIDRALLFAKVRDVVTRYRDTIDCDHALLMRLLRQVIFHDPTTHCTVRGQREDWAGLPKSKSLFFAGHGKGLPIGNLTSQLFGNVYLNDFDHFITCTLGCRYYGRYVDDMVIIHRDKEFLKSIISVINAYLRMHLFLRIHPRKVYLQHVSRGVCFLGAVIKPHRLYVGSKTKVGCFRCVRKWNDHLARHAGTVSKEDVAQCIASMNAYLGAMKPYRTYRLRKKMLTELMAGGWQRYVQPSPAYETISPASLTPPIPLPAPTHQCASCSPCVRL